MSLSATMNQPALELQNVTFRYDADEAPVIVDISLTVRPGEWLAITGHSGSGKSTIAQLLSGYLPRAGGGIRDGVLLVGGLDPAEASIAEVVKRIGIVFQDPDAQLVQGRVEDEVAFGPENLRFDVPAIEQRVTDALAAVELAERRSDSVHALSGGQRQRTAIAAVLALAPPVLVLDEPVASLDAKSRRRFLALLRRLHGEGRTIVTVSGRLDELAQAAPRLIVMDGGRVVMDGLASELMGREGVRLAELGVLPAMSMNRADLGAPVHVGEQLRVSTEPDMQSLSQTAHGIRQQPPPPELGEQPQVPADPDLPSLSQTKLAMRQQSPTEPGMQPLPPPSMRMHSEGQAQQKGSQTPGGASSPMNQATANRSQLHRSAHSPLLQIDDLSFAYGKSGLAVLHDVNLTLDPGEWRLLCGDNGSGKTTLSRLLMGLLTPPRGTIWWQGKDAAKLKLYDLAEDIGYVFQQPEHQFVAATVMEELLYGPRFQMRLKAGEALPKEISERAEELLHRIGLSGRGQVSPYLLSGGEKRLLSAAAAMMLPKKLYILDEPTAGADYSGIIALAALCRRAVAEGASVILITHEPECFAGEPLSIWRMHRGRLQL